MPTKKPSVEEIKEQIKKCEKHYSGLWEKFEEDEKFYELAFKDKMNIAKDFDADRVILPTARDVVDVAVNHTDIMNARIFVNKKGTSNISAEAAEMQRKLALGLIHRTNVESRIAPGHTGAKHYWIHGLAVFKSIWDADRWVNKPEQKEGEDEEAYAIRLDEWRAATHLSLPIIIQAVHPANIMPDPYTGGDLYIIETQKRLVYDIKRTAMWQHWRNPNNMKDDEEVLHRSVWDKDWRCDLMDGEPILKIRGGVVNHKYDFIPYTLIESGLGNLAKDAAPEKRYVGLLRYIIDLLISESTNYSMCDILMKRETMKGGYITGADAKSLPKVKQKYGEYWPVGNKDVVFHDWESKLAPEEAYRHLALTHDYIAGHAAPRSVRGMSETGVRSGADRRLVMAEAAAIYRYASPAFANGWANILSKCARLVKNVIPGDFEIWARTPTDEFDVVIKKNLLREPFNYYVEFAPISEEDEYRRHEDLMRRVQAGIIDEEYAWQRQSDVDPADMRRRMEKKKLRDSPIYQQVKAETLSLMFQQQAQASGLLPAAQPMQGEVPPEAEGQGGRSLVPGVPERAALGSAQERDNQWRQTVGRPRQNVYQGFGGGGNR